MLSMVLLGIGAITYMVIAVAQSFAHKPPVLKRQYNQWKYIKQIEDEVEDDGD